VLEHGGRLREAARCYAQSGNFPLTEWLDLSTGINPAGYPVPPLDPACWQRLPEDGDGLESAAAAYYGNERLLALPGSQAAIQLLSALFPPAAVAFIAPLYEEHPQAWARAGHKLRHLHGADAGAALSRALAAATPCVVLCNPNNPTALALPRGALLEAAAQLRRRGGWLIVDEAFGDAEPDNCVAPLAGGADAPNLIVLRSLGKFFGLAGARVGFVFAAPQKLGRLREALGPWPVSGPARAAARHALADGAWQADTRRRLAAASARLAGLLGPLGKVTATALFATVHTAEASALHEHLARRAILTRCFADYGLLRFGLPGSEAGWRRLGAALDEWKPTC
jgi:cobalamin biosynthetic protein CobC